LATGIAAGAPGRECQTWKLHQRGGAEV